MPPDKDNLPPRYTHFILLLWEERQAAAGPGAWRLSLEDPHSGRRVGFKDLQEMSDFLRNWMNHPDLDDESHHFMDPK